MQIFENFKFQKVTNLGSKLESLKLIQITCSQKNLPIDFSLGTKSRHRLDHKPYTIFLIKRIMNTSGILFYSIIPNF